MLTWSDVNGINFWEEHRGSEQTGRIVLTEWLERHCTSDTAEVAARLVWRAPEGAPLVEQRLARAQPERREKKRTRIRRCQLCKGPKPHWHHRIRSP